jgi:hypothetical protein
VDEFDYIRKEVAHNSEYYKVTPDIKKKREDVIDEFESFLEDLESKLQRNIDSGITLYPSLDEDICTYDPNKYYIALSINLSIYGEDVDSILAGLGTSLTIEFYYLTRNVNDRVSIFPTFDFSGGEGKSLREFESRCYDFFKNIAIKYISK